jgi:hypothetical protein
MVVIWFHEMMTQVKKSGVSYCSQSRRICVADSSFSRHLGLDLYVNPNMKRCPFR